MLRRLQPHLESIGFFADSMFGFRPNLSTQDVLLQLKKDILDYPGTAQTRAVLALDLKGAFDNVSHDTILEGLARARCGRRTYEYVSSFLKDRIATLGIGDQRSGLILLTGRGTPQGSVLSPTLFNIAMAGLPSILNNIPRIRHSLYADDTTVWVESGSDGEIQDALQTAADATQEYARAAGLSCAADKSELLLIRGMAKLKINEEITVSIDGKPIPSAKRLRILGLQLQTDAKASFTVQMLRKQCLQIAHLIRRVTSKRRGLKEGDTIRIVQALLVSRIVYHAPSSKIFAEKKLMPLTPLFAWRSRRPSASRNTRRPSAYSN